MPRQDLITSKLNALGKMVESLERNEKVLARIGEVDHGSRKDEINFQQNRINNLRWARNVTDQAIQFRLKRLEKDLTPEELSCKYGVVKGLASEKVTAIALIEDLEIALGIHPGVS